jgi:hypothetical protein
MRAQNPPFTAVLLLTAGAIALAALTPACKDNGGGGSGSGSPPPVSSTPPPPSTVAKAGACASGGGEDTDALSAAVFPRTLKVGAGDYCLDPQGQIRAFGEKASLTLEDVCTTAVDGECEVYKHFGLKRFVSLRYVDGTGAGGSVEVYLSQYADPGGAYGMFTKRVIADGDPADPSAPKFLDVGGAGAIGTGRAYVWRADQLAELQYINENESPDQLAKSSQAVLAPLAKSIGANIRGGVEKPPSAGALPSANIVVPNAIAYFPKDALGVSHVGAGAVGYYKDGDKRYRLAAFQKDDADQAKDVMKTLKGKAGSASVPGPGEESLHVVLQAAPEAPKVEWLFTRKGALVAGIGDEETLLKAGDSPEQQAKVRLAKDDAIAKLKGWIAASPTPAAAPSAGAKKKAAPDGEGGALRK